MVELVLYKNNSDDKVVSKNITPLATLNGALRKACSLIDPVVDITINNNAILAQLNYAKISQFGRYYYVKNITYKGNLVELQLHVDVISSFQTELKSLSAVIARQENKYNLYLQDGYFKTYQNPHVSIKQFPNGFDTQQFILAVAGGGGFTPTPTNELNDNSEVKE